MADNYLEKKFEEFNSRPQKSGNKAPAKGAKSLDTLLLKNRSTRGYSHGRVLSEAQLKEIVAVNTRIASSKNQQALRFKIITAGEQADFVNANIKMGALFKGNPHLPLPGTDPQSFIVVYATHPEDASLLIDLGISLQSMSLKAVELGFNCLMIRAFNKEAMLSLLPSDAPSLYPLAVLAVGKSAETIYLVPNHGGPQDYYRKDGIHFVPKLGLDNLLV